jgi:hypothetical protein
MTFYRATKTAMMTIVVAGVAVAYVTTIVAFIGFVGPSIVVFVAVSACALMLLSAIAFFGASQAQWRQKATSNEREHAA